MKRFFAIALTLAASVAFGATTVPVQLLNTAGSSSGNTIVSTGPSSAATWGALGLSGLSSIAANTVVANFSASSAAPSAFTMPTCNSSASALQFTPGTGVVCGTVATAGANSNITSLTGLTTPLGTSAGGLGANNGAASGVPIFSSGAATVTAVTGTGSPVLGTSPTIATPNVVGVANGTTAAAGSIGEYLCAQVTSGGTPSGCQSNSSTPVSLTTATAANVTSLSLTAGFWQVCGNIYFAPNAATVVSQLVGQISLTSSTLSTPPNFGSGFLWGGSVTGAAQAFSAGCRVLWFSSTTTVYLVAQSNFTTNTNAAYGFIWALRFH
ncbi:MAG TPA: hypothetical protein VHC91_10555 [Trinickia sp.]|uniref:hypothetical protein n=1 Tax=Trinickia sp. TaxID=2571163 RepID=UPI002CB02823|nr:hypothetical protein [Trinickia sp.]HVW50818.1 hypothetical protein [Trinickia sp.]